MTQYVDPETAFPRIEDNLLLYDYPRPGVKSYVKVDNIQYSTYEYVPGSVTASAASDYGSNKLDNLIPNSGHLYLVIPTINPEDVHYIVTSAATGSVTVLADGDTNSRVTGMSGNGEVGQMAFSIRESIRMRLKFPPTVPAWGLDQLATPGDIDWLRSSPESPNASFMFAVTDNMKTGQLQVRFEMPASNVAATAGMKNQVIFYVAFMAFHPLPGPTSPYTPVPTVFPAQGNDYQMAPGTRQNVGVVSQ